VHPNTRRLAMTSAIKTPKRRFLLTVLVGAALLGVLLLLPASGEAHKKGPPEDDCAVDANINAEGWGDVCFEAHGDAHWVRDQTPNEWSVRAQIQTDYGKTRWCANTHGADSEPVKASWHRCNFNHLEDRCVRWRMFEQREAPPQVGFTRKWTRWSGWTHTTFGDRAPRICPARHGDPIIP
jgi:hypothetical protein